MEWTPSQLAAWYKTPTGIKVVGAVSATLASTEAARWQGSTRPLVLDVGYAQPFTKLWPHGVIDSINPATLGDDNTMECRYDRLLVAHALENPAHDTAELLQRCCQALRPDGVLVAIVPASFSLCRLCKGPFAAGRCFTASRLAALLTEAGFTLHGTHRTAGVLVATAGKRIGGTKVLVSKPVTGKIQAIPAGVATKPSQPSFTVPHVATFLRRAPFAKGLNPLG